KLRVGRDIKSAPLLVDARHSMLDAAASGGALIGLIAVALGFPAGDPLAGFAITALIIHIGIDATRDVFARLMDESDEEAAGAVRAVAVTVPGVFGASDVRVRWLGRELEARLTVQVPSGLSMGEAHELTHSVEEAVRASVPDIREVMVEPVPVSH